jgi:hypothetical protein
LAGSSRAGRPKGSADSVAHVDPAVALDDHESTALRIKDGLPKFKDVPEEFGGSGGTIAE